MRLLDPPVQAGGRSAVTGTTYLSAYTLCQLDAAQIELDDHICFGIDGHCARCGEIEPCTPRRQAAAVFARYGALPRRRPQLALPRAVLRRVA